MRVNFARLVLSQSCSLFLIVVSFRLRIISLILSLSAATSPLRIDLDGPSQIAFGHGRRDVRDGAHLRGEIRRELIDVIGQIFPRSGSAGHVGLAAEFSFDTDFARHRGHLVGKGRQRIDHAVDRVGQFGDFAFGFDQQFSFQIAIRDRGHDFRDTAHLVGQVDRP